MTQKQYYRRSTALPIIVPIPVLGGLAAIARLGWDRDLPIPYWVGEIVSLLGVSLIYGGLNHIPFLLWHFCGSCVTERRVFIVDFLGCFRLVFAGFFLICFSVWWAIEGRISFSL